jgi:hypothetical protein
VDDRNEPLVLPQCCGVHRGRALDALDAVVVNDVFTTFDKMVASGWPVADALDALHHGYRAWLMARFGHALDFGLGLLDMEAAA